MIEIRCAFISSYFGPYFSNYVASTIALEKQMQKNNAYTIYIFPKEVKSFNWIKKLEKINNRIYFLDYSPNSIKNVIEIRKIFKNEKINIIYSRMCGWDFTAHFAAPTLPIIWHMDLGVNRTKRIKKIKNWLKFHVLAFGKTYHVGVSEAVTESINFYRPKNRCTSIINAIDLSRLQKKEDYQKNDLVRLLIFGWSPLVKGLDTAIEACTLINKDSVKVELLVSAQEKTYKFIDEYFASSQKPTWIKLLPPTDDVSNLYLNCDIMISASRSESFSYCLAEAIYSGLPVIYSDIPGTSWASSFKKTFKFITSDANSLKKAIECASNEKMDKESHEENCIMMEERYSINKWAKNVYNYIRSI